MQPEPIASEQKQVLRAQYTTLFINVEDLLKKDGQSHKNSNIWYKICTSSSCFKSTKDIIHFALSFPVRDQPEYSVKSLIGNIQEVDS